jgi:hypothetical protein
VVFEMIGGTERMVERTPRNRWFLGVLFVTALMGLFGCGSDSKIGVVLPKETPVATVTPPIGQQQRGGPTPTATPLERKGVSASYEHHGLRGLAAI